MNTVSEHPTILLVEDNHAHAELVMRGLNNEADKAIRHVADGEEALDYLLRRGDYENPDLSPRPNLILLDLRLPKVDGLQVLKKIKDTDDLQKIPVVILTTSDADRDLNEAYQFNANSYLVKPIDFEAFNKLMADLRLYWLNWNHAPHRCH